ncbi:HNH endonuclease [Salinarchaeum laminariae]|uniref:HNH endonuclease n=1 Tax=Salinarchaeum laminariae TaxID=869888 RepID=UPI0020BED1FB|nr:HNH endonuclease signature motif containing protein [Salinarchaeum laminariae]
MDCAGCGDSLDEFLVTRYRSQQLPQPLCFACYLASDVTTFDYSEYDPRVDESAVAETIEAAIAQKNEFRIELLVEQYDGEGIVLFAPTRSDAETLVDVVEGSAIGRFVGETNILDLATAYETGDPRACWQAANWTYDPYHRSHTTAAPTVSVVGGVPCIVDGYRYIGDDAAETINEALLERFLDDVDITELASLRDVRTAVADEFPIAVEFGVGISAHVEQYFRRNPEHLSTTFATIGENGRQNDAETETSLEELEQLYDSEVEASGTATAEILELLELAKGARSQAIADVVGCSVGHARRFTYDEASETAIEKDWSQTAQNEKVSPGTRERIVERDGDCLRCGEPEGLTVHHIVPIAAGGTNRDENLATLCATCHRAAHDGSFYPPTTVYDGHDGFDAWIERSDRDSGG